ncbi:MAG: AAA family ATPase, partial [Firmicutes bacterium]|nr:AAA family ATPase [Bacillota bacterium]
MPNFQKDSGDLFAQAGQKDQERQAPLAWQLRPQRLEELVGQQHLTQDGGILRTMWRQGLRSAVFYGPPGTGKTSAARILAESAQKSFCALSAMDTGSKDIREKAQEAIARMQAYGRGTVLFIDEIHRLNRAQQDGLLPYVENGTFVLLAATTENPWVSLQPALLSRILPIEFYALTPAAIRQLLKNVWQSHEQWWPQGSISEEAQAMIAQKAGGDARQAIGLLEQSALLAQDVQVSQISLEIVQKVLAGQVHYHDQSGQYHYDITSALIKSIRGSDPDAALYWFGRLLKGGTDPQYIMRRLLVHAAEDIGLADPQALILVQAAHA